MSRSSRLLQRILRQHRIIQLHQLRALILTLSPEPKARDEQRAAARDERRPIHDSDAERRRVREAEDNQERHDV